MSPLPPWLSAGAGRAHGIGRLLDYTLLKPDARRDDLLRLADEAVRISAWAVCVNGAWVATCAERIAGTDVRVVSVVDFPLGAGSAAAKAAEAAEAVADGAAEIDVVLSPLHARSGNWAAAADEVGQVVAATHGALVKVIIESAALDAHEIERACRAAVAGGAAFVKTSTGFHAAGGATIDAVRLMRGAVGSGVGVKASGGVRGREQALAMIAAGANRLGLSSLAGLEAIVGPGAPPFGELLGRHAEEVTG
ncbi:MAG TPA: deoxyribose-phosphate aldolase [Gemmatimonadales bacterium]|nr:deoxyribose-phosphate aldolase [Gemmatimonadales bacterium]